MKILADRDDIKNSIDYINLALKYLTDDRADRLVVEHDLNKALEILFKLLKDNPIAAEDLESGCFVTKDEYGRVMMIGRGVSPKAWSSPLPETKVAKEELTDRQLIIELLETLIQNEKRKNIGLGANIITLLQSELVDLKDKVVGVE
jgi:hypothetical protein